MANLFRVLEQQANSVEVEHYIIANDETHLRSEIQKLIDAGDFNANYIPQDLGEVFSLDGTAIGPSVLTRDATDPSVWRVTA